MVNKKMKPVLVIAIIALVAGSFYGLAWALLGLWNSTIPVIFPNVQELNFWLAFRLLLLLAIIGGFIGGGHNATKNVISKPDNNSKGIHIGFGKSDDQKIEK